MIQILGLLGMYFDAVVGEVKTFLLLFRLTLSILWLELEKHFFLATIFFFHTKIIKRIRIPDLFEFNLRSIEFKQAIKADKSNVTKLMHSAHQIVSVQKLT